MTQKTSRPAPARRQFLAGAISASALGLVLAGAPMVASAEPVVLKMATALPAGNLIQENVYAPWVKRINDAAEGEFQIQMYGPTLAGAANVWERTINGVADIGVIVLGPSGQPFTKSNITTLPGVLSDINAGSIALYRLYSKGLIADEYKDVHVLAMATIPKLGLTSKEPITKLEDLKGQKARAPDKMSADVLTALGASPIAVPFLELYQSLSRGVVTAAVGNSFSISAFRMGEVAKNHLHDLSFGMQASAIVMNKAAYAKLSPKGKAIMDKMTGEASSGILGSLSGKLDASIMDELRKQPDQKFNHLTPAELARWKTAMDTVVKAWVERTPDGAKLLSTMQGDYEAVVAKNK